MKHSTRLWIEMLQYEKLPKAPDNIQVVICDIPEVQMLINLAADCLKNNRWKVRTKNSISDKEFRNSKITCWYIVPMEQRTHARPESEFVRMIYVPYIYGLEGENTLFPDVERYRETLRDKSECICAGEFLCQLAHILSIDEGEREYVMTAEKISFDDGTYMVWKSDNKNEDFFYFDQTYNGKLRELQKAQLRILNEFDRICRMNNISYFLGGGTLLGAVRHQGIIPWDDDIDVMMRREEYEKFVKVVQKDIGKDFHYQSNKTDLDYHSIFDKIRLNNTVFKTRYSQQFSRMHQGIFMDIFVQDKTSNYKLGQKLHEFLTLFARSLVFHKWEGTDMHFYGRMKLLCHIMTRYKNHVSMKKLEKIQYKVVTWYRHKNTGYLYDGTGDHLRNGAYPEKWLEKGRMGVLEGRKYPIPAEAEKYLQYIYGKDYMRLPAPQDRKSTHPIIELKL